MGNDLVDVLECAKILAKENPCGLSRSVMSSMADGLRMMLCRDYHTGMSQEDVRKYLGVQSTRTIQRWAERYADFPKMKKVPGKQPMYDAMEVIAWKRNHACQEPGEDNQ